MKVLVVNCGSSSIKYQLFDMPRQELLAKGQVERIGDSSASLSHQNQGHSQQRSIESLNIFHATRFLAHYFTPALKRRARLIAPGEPPGLPGGYLTND